jgi:acetyl esterase/lipase
LAWTFKHIRQYGGRTDRIFVSGHSAGGYLALMLALDKQYLNACGADADSVAAYLPVSGQTATHYTIRKERGLPNGIPVIDQYAPANKARKDTPPIVLITGDRRLEMADRYEENALLASVLKNIGNKQVTLHELQGFDHGTVVGPACYLIREYVRKFK